MYSNIRVKEDLLDFSDRGRLFQSFTVLTAKVCPPSEMFLLYTYLQEMAWTSIRVQISYALFLLYAAFTPLFWIPTPCFWFLLFFFEPLPDPVPGSVPVPGLLGIDLVDPLIFPSFLVAKF